MVPGRAAAAGAGRVIGAGALCGGLGLFSQGGGPVEDHRGHVARMNGL